MLKFICLIPDIIGWIMVGVVAAGLAVAMVVLTKLCVKIWKEFQEENA